MSEPGGRYFRKSIDDAALFPPASLPVGPALAQHFELMQGDAKRLVRSFSIATHQIKEFIPALEEISDPISLSVIGRPAQSARAWDEAREFDSRQISNLIDAAEELVSLVSYEVLVPDGISIRRAVQDLDSFEEGDLYLEIPGPSSDTEPELFAADISETAPSVGIKLRTGGVNPNSVPKSDFTARVILAAAQCELPLKCTAGLHHAYPHHNPASGDQEYGFLNIAAAFVLAYELDLSQNEAEQILAAPSGLVNAAGDLAWESLSVPQSASARIQNEFLRIGTCSVKEVMDELQAAMPAGPAQ